jgi:hypothetical protein
MLVNVLLYKLMYIYDDCTTCTSKILFCVLFNFFCHQIIVTSIQQLRYLRTTSIEEFKEKFESMLGDIFKMVWESRCQTALDSKDFRKNSFPIGPLLVRPEDQDWMLRTSKYSCLRCYNFRFLHLNHKDNDKIGKIPYQSMCRRIMV